MNVLVALGVAVAAFAIDQASKIWVLDVVGLRHVGFIEVLPILNFALAYNTGVNFGIFAGGSETQQLVLAGFAALVSLALLIWASRSTHRFFAVAVGLVVGGALGNALDRLRVGAVVDFINFDCCGIGNPYAFNIADAAIFLGAIAIAVLHWRDESPKKTEESKEPDDA